MSFGSRLVACGSYFPEKILTNKELESFIDTSDEWIRTRTGIEARHIADPTKNESTVELSARAAQAALKKAGLKAEDLDLIIVGTVTPDTVMPCTANQVQAKIGATKAFTFDLQAACSGWLYGLSIADQYLRNGKHQHALVIGAETLSTVTNWRDRSTCVLFGDGAGASVLSRTEDPKRRILSTRLYSDGTLGDLLAIPHGFAKVPPDSAEYRHDKHKVVMNGKEIFKYAVRNMMEASYAVLSENDVRVEDVDFFIFHQANIRIIDMCLKMMKVEPKKTWINIAKYGNTSAATLPVCIDEATRAGMLKEGDLVLLSTFGGGVTWGAALLRL